MPYDFFKKQSSDDQIEERIRWEKEKAKPVQKQPRLPRQQVPPEAWSCADSVDYFLDLMSQDWKIPAYKVKRSSFIAALSGKRKAFETNGEVERRMMGLFFQSLRHESFTNGDALWGNFINKFSNLEQLARAGIVDPEREEQLQAAAESTWDWMEE